MFPVANQSNVLSFFRLSNRPNWKCPIIGGFCLPTNKKSDLISRFFCLRKFRQNCTVTVPVSPAMTSTLPSLSFGIPGELIHTR